MTSLLLAAGRGKRAGGPKAWKEHEGKSLLRRQLEFLVPRFGAGNVRVSIQQEWLERCRALNPGVHWIPVDPDAEPIDSLRALDVEGWRFVHHVDMPVWEPALFDALQPSGEDAVVPVHEGKRGHPVLLSPRLKLTKRLDALLRESSVREVAVAHACIRENWNA